MSKQIPRISPVCSENLVETIVCEHFSKLIHVNAENMIIHYTDRAPIVKRQANIFIDY